tara:strand:- start:3948 stop:5123 length:1176 start_codon:yes stop_codon:yes gene_type:complete
MAEHDYIINNGTGSAVRTDLNNALAAIASNNSKATDLTTNYAYQWYADTGDNTLKIRNAANNAYINVSITGGIETENFGLAPLTGATFTGDIILDNQADLRFEEATANGSNYIALQAPTAIASDVTLTLPAVAPTANQVLKADASTPTTLTWAAETGGDKIEEGNSSVEVIDSGTGSVEITIDGSNYPITFSGTGLLFEENVSNAFAQNIIRFHDTDNQVPIGGRKIGQIDFETSDSNGSGIVARILGNSASNTGGGKIDFFTSDTHTPSLVNRFSIAETGIATFTNDVIFSDSIVENVFAITDASTVALNPTNGTIQTWTLGGNRTATDNLSNGQSMLLMVADGSGYALTFPTTTWVGGSPPTLATSGFTVIEFWKVSSTLYAAHVGDVA